MEAKYNVNIMKKLMREKIELEELLYKNDYFTDYSPMKWYDKRNLKQTLKKIEEINNNLIYASHFGNLQFLHGMASRGNKRSFVKTNIMRNAEHSWKTAIKANTYTLKALRIRFLKYHSNKIKGIEADQENYEEKFVRRFALGDLFYHTRKKDQLSLRALGSLLHMVQDSYAKGHTVREGFEAGENNGRIRYFQNYAEQDSSKHGKLDKQDEDLHWSTIPGAQMALKRSTDLIMFFMHKCTWVKPLQDINTCPKGGVSSYLKDEVFSLVPMIDDGNQQIDYINNDGTNDRSTTRSHVSLRK